MNALGARAAGRSTLLDRVAAPPFVETTIDYIDPQAEIGAINDEDRRKSTLKILTYPVRMYDARAIEDSLSLEGNGFVLDERAPPECDFLDEASVRANYFPHAEKVVQDWTGAALVRCFGYATRDGDPAKDSRRPAFNAHVDYNEKTMRDVAAKLASFEPDPERLLSGRLMIINVWRPLSVVEKSALALCDAASIAAEDLVHGPIAGNPLAGVTGAAGFNLAYNPAHAWFYFPYMRPEEAMVFKICDSNRDAIQWTGHSSFERPDTPADAKPRRSIEVRTIAFFPKS